MENFDDIFNSQQTTENTPVSNENFDKEAWAAKKQAERDSLFTLLDDCATEMGNSPAALGQYLDVQSRFMRMSANNALLIAAQRPNATQLASFDDWKQQEVSILAGEKAISILEQGDAYTRDDGTEGRYTNIAKVFDVSQTSAEPAPEEPAPDTRTLMKALATNSGTRMEVTDNLPDGRNALYSPETNTIAIRPGVEGNALFAELTRELAQASLCRDGSTQRDNALAAYCASYMLCKKYGMDTRGYSLDGASKAFGGMDAKGVRAELGRARNAAEGISFQMDKTINPQQRSDRKNDAR